MAVEDPKKEAWLQREKELEKDAPACSCNQPRVEIAIHYPGCALLNFWVRKYMEFLKESRIAGSLGLQENRPHRMISHD